ncbi:MAG TPA: potassium channel protein [Dissulfurispiraceae bacterium]|nr:potassium channel protein [Dissulfurispiraceae bacterium]
MLRELQIRLLISLAMIVVVVSFGTAGYMILEEWNLLDSLYMTTITLASVGFKEVHDLSQRGVVFTIVLIAFGVGTFAYALSTAARVILEGELQQIFGRKRLEKRLRELKNHFIICGYGRMGKIICRELKVDGIPFVAIEKNAESMPEDESLLTIEGDATRDDLLRQCGIERARGLISVLPTDAENLYVVLSARELNPDLFIVARAGEEGSEKKLLRAGANKVVSPYHIGGLRIAHTVLRPAVVDFIEFATKSGNLALQMEEVTIPEGSALSGMSLDQCGFGRELGVIIVAIKRLAGEMEFNPTFRSTIATGDTLIALGEIPRLKKLEELAGVRQ